MNTIKTLIEDYQRRLKNAETLLATNENNGSINHVKREERIRTKAGEYRTIIAELQRINDPIAWVEKRTEETYDRCKIIEEYKSNIGKAVAKCSIGEQKENGKKFKSGNTVNTIKGVIMHEFIDEPAYIFEEDDSYVECRRCKIVETETH
jgi:hypothetical protein